jgi:ABC-2 type transport system permease protein
MTKMVASTIMTSEISPFLFYRRIIEVWIRQSWTRFNQVLKHSKLMLGFIALFVLGYWVVMTWSIYEGLMFVQWGIPALGDLLISRMFYVLFALIFLMLITSSGVVGYGVMFKNRETLWMQTLPLSHEMVFRIKFLELSLLASWAFLFLSGPIILAYGLALKLSISFLICVVLLYIPFSLLANSLGAAAILFLVRGWHTTLGKRLIILGCLTVILISYSLFKPIDIHQLQEAEMVPLMNMLLDNSRITTSPLLPSYWMASATIALGDRLWLKPFFYFALTLSYTLLAIWLVVRYCGNLFYQNSSLVRDHSASRRLQSDPRYTSRLYSMGKILSQAVPWVRPSIREILVKDWVTFWRDPGQWSQFAIFFGLLGFYFINIRNFRQPLDDKFWTSIVAFLNLASLGLIVATLTTRFVFPQFSLEGRRLWLLGLAPIRLRDIIWGKFWSSAVGGGAVTLALMYFSFSSLHLESSMRWLIGMAVVLMNFGLSGIAVGMGVLFPNLKQTNAAQIVSGFGGTLCLILSLIFVALVVLGVAVPTHVRYVSGLPIEFRFTSTTGLIYTLTFFVSSLAGILPMKLAQRKLDRLEI